MYVQFSMKYKCNEHRKAIFYITENDLGLTVTATSSSARIKEA